MLRAFGEPIHDESVDGGVSHKRACKVVSRARAVGARIKEAIANGSWLSPGRPKGSRNKLGEDLIVALTEDFAKHGKRAIETVRQDRPAAYLKLMLHPRTHF